MLLGSGNVFLFSGNKWAVLDKDTGKEVQTITDPVKQTVTGVRSGSISAGGTTLPIKASDGYRAEIIFFGGGIDSKNKVSSYNYIYIMILVKLQLKLLFLIIRSPHQVLHV